jgi:hypothetical protein
MTQPKEYTPYFLCYCKSLGLDPDVVFTQPKTTYPFVNWMHRQWHQWKELTGFPQNAPIGPQQHDLFGQWLEQQVA